MTRTRFMLSLGVALVSVACDDELPSRWATTPIVVDGQPDDWERVPLFHVEGHDFAFATQNDASNLYVYFSTSSPEDQRRLSTVGVTVWLNEEGDEEETRGIRFWPTSAGPRGTPETAPEVPESLASPEEDAPRLRHPTAQPAGDYSGDLDAEVGEMFFRGNLAFEIRFPLSTPVRDLALGLSVPVASRSGGARSKAKGGGGMGGAMGMGGGMGPGGMGGGMGRGGKGGGMGNRGMARGGPGGMGPGGEPGAAGAGSRSKRHHPTLSSEVIWITVIPSSPPG